MRKTITPAGIAPPASHYPHAVLTTAPNAFLHLSGQLGERPDGSISGDAKEQALQAWANIEVILEEGGMTIGDIVKVTSYIVGREHIPAYVEAHKQAVGDDAPPWTLLLVDGLGAPEYLVEVDVEAMA